MTFDPHVGIAGAEKMLYSCIFVEGAQRRRGSRVNSIPAWRLKAGAEHDITVDDPVRRRL